jgi:hypothetical protein
VLSQKPEARFVLAHAGDIGRHHHVMAGHPVCVPDGADAAQLGIGLER